MIRTWKIEDDLAKAMDHLARASTLISNAQREAGSERDIASLNEAQEHITMTRAKINDFAKNDL